MKTQSGSTIQPGLETGTGIGILQLAAPEYGSLDTEKLARVRTLLADHAENSTPPYLVLDLSKVHYFGASFIGILVSTWDRLRKRERRLVLCGLTPYCGKLIRALHLDRLFDICSTWPIALEAPGHPSSSEATQRAGIRVRKSEVGWDPHMLRLEYIGDDNVPFRSIIVRREPS
jgi:anti-anti-sigma factor